MHTPCTRHDATVVGHATSMLHVHVHVHAHVHVHVHVHGMLHAHVHVHVHVQHVHVHACAAHTRRGACPAWPCLMRGPGPAWPSAWPCMVLHLPNAVRCGAVRRSRTQRRSAPSAATCSRYGCWWTPSSRRRLLLRGRASSSPCPGPGPSPNPDPNPSPDPNLLPAGVSRLRRDSEAVRDRV